VASKSSRRIEVLEVGNNLISTFKKGYDV